LRESFPVIFDGEARGNVSYPRRLRNISLQRAQKLDEKHSSNYCMLLSLSTDRAFGDLLSIARLPHACFPLMQGSVARIPANFEFPSDWEASQEACAGF
jgi:hypothetical protein